MLTTGKEPSKISHAKDLYDEIFSKIQKSSKWFATFASLLSTNIWKSSLELAETWIELVAPDEYKELMRVDNESEVEAVKQDMRWKLIKIVSEGLNAFSRHPSMLQKMTTELLVLKTLVSDLPTHDQDRIIAKEAGLPYRVWQAIIWLLTHNSELLDLFQESRTTIGYWRDGQGKSIYTICVHGSNPDEINPLKEIIPGIEIEHALIPALEFHENHLTIREEILSIIILSKNILQRFESIIWPEKEQAIVRSSINEKFGPIPTWKKRSFRGNNKKEADERGLVPVGARR